MATAIPENQATFSLEEIARLTGGDLQGDSAVTCIGVVIDSRAVSQGALFVAVRGERTDGHAYLEMAKKAGCGAALVRRGEAVPEGLATVAVDDTTRALGLLARHHRQRWGGRVVAITGSAGKTTTKELTAGALQATGLSVLKTPGNLNNQFGVPMSLLMLSAEHDVAVLELGTSGAGEIAYLGDLVEPDVAAVLLAAAAHTEGLGSVESVAREKASLWGTLRPGGVAIVNADDERLLALVEGHSSRRSFGKQAHADVRLVGCRTTTHGTDVEICVQGRVETVGLKLLGEPAAIDACCALACCVALCGAEALDQVMQGLAKVQPTPGRLALHRAAAGFWVLDDSYNANPESMALGLQTLAALAQDTGGRSLATLGDMRELGALSREAHARVGALAVELGLEVLIGHGVEMAAATGAAVRAAAGRFATHPTRVLQLSELSEVIRVLSGLLRPDDVVLIKGSRSMHMEAVSSALLGGNGL